MLPSQRFVAYAEGRFGPMTSKTANACLRYTPERVVAVLDSTQTGRTAQEVLGFGGAVPVVASLDDAAALRPTALLIGIAPQGGQLPPHARGVVLDALRRGMEVWSGLHFFLGDDPEFAAASRASGAAIRDLRRPPAQLDVATGRVRELDATVILTVGTDCNIGKMTTQLQLRSALQARGLRTAFAATGQTGILVEGRGIAVDAVVADFIAGAAERLTLEAGADADLVLVEGQGALSHPGYSGVTLGLLHGSLPHGMVLCHQPSRTHITNNPWVPIPALPDAIRLYETAAAALRPAPVVAVALNTFDLPEDEARRAIERASAETGLPATDPVRFDPAPIVDALERFHASRRGGAVAAG